MTNSTSHEAAAQPLQKAQQGLKLLKEAMLELLKSSDHALTHAQIVNALDLHSDFRGSGRNYLSWSVLGLLVNADEVRYEGNGQKRVYFVREDQLSIGP